VKRSGTDAAIQMNVTTQLQGVKKSAIKNPGWLGRATEKRLLPAAVCRAEDAMHALHVEVHYLSCDGGVGHKRPAE
jgi:hypothetical protein